MEGVLERLLRHFKLKESDVRNPQYYDQGSEVLERWKAGECDEACLERLLRVVSTNRAMVEHGLSPLVPNIMMEASEVTIGQQQQQSAAEQEVSKPSSLLDEEEEAAMKRMGLTWEEYACIRGTKGRVCGLWLGTAMYDRLFWKCKSKKARRLSKDPNASLEFLMKKIKTLAHKRMQRRRLFQLKVTTIR